jgi:hypothetical protein
MESARGLARIGAIALLAACGRVTSQGTEPLPDGSVALDAAAPVDATVSAEEAGTFLTVDDDAGPPYVYDAGSCPVPDAASLVGRVPTSHRDAGETCPPRGSSPPTSTCGEDGGVQCTVDSDCTAGKNGRCLLTPHIPPPPTCTAPYCSYDACESDSDCNGVPCDCRAAGSANPNVCATGSNCVTDCPTDPECRYDTTLGHFGCLPACIPPP